MNYQQQMQKELEESYKKPYEVKPGTVKPIPGGFHDTYWADITTIK